MIALLSLLTGELFLTAVVVEIVCRVEARRFKYARA